MSEKKRVAITGVGPLSSIGKGKEEVWRSILNHKTGLVKEDFYIDGNMTESFYFHKINDFDIDQYGIDENILRDIRVWKQQEFAADLFYLMAVIKLALNDSGRQVVQDSEKTGLILFHENPGLDQFYEDMINESYDIQQEVKFKNEYFYEISKRFLKRGYDLQTFMFIFHAARAFSIKGYSLFLNNACASGLFALETASDVIKSGKCDTMIVAGADCGSIFKYIWFKEVGMYPEDGRIKPFAEGRDGFVFGDGGAGIVMEDYDQALRRGANIYAEYMGGNFVLEGWKVTVPDITGDSYKKAITGALDRSDLDAEEIDLLVPHGVGTKISDAYEARGIKSVFGDNPPLITALKPYVGHNLGSSALLETIIMLIALERNMVPSTLNCEKVGNDIKIDLVRQHHNTELNIVMKTACGFAGFNSACIFKKPKGF